MSNTIHPTAIVDARAKLGGGVSIGPYCVIEGAVTLGTGTVVLSHTVIHGSTRVGDRCRIGPGAYVGLDPQHRGYAGQETWLVVGDDAIIREGASLHRATHEGEDHATRVGARCYIMAYGHVGHDCIVGDDVTIAHGAMLGGHVTVGNRAFLGGACGIHQFCRIGQLAIVGGGLILVKDVPPFAAVKHEKLKGYNAVGCRRAGLSREVIQAIRSAYRQIHANRSFAAGVAAIDPADAQIPEIRELIEFASNSKRGVLHSAHAGDEALDDDSSQ